jgi:hypothetical protein
MGLINRKQSTPQKSSGDALSQQEIKFILKSLSEGKFDGKDVFLVSGIVQKLSDSIESE